MANYDPFVANADEAPSGGVMATIDETGLSEGQTVYVATYGDYFSWHPYQALAPVPNVVINGARGQWTRMGVPNPKWQTQTTWSIDESNITGLASDENSGIDDTHPLLNIEEFIRRMAGSGGYTSTIAVRWLSDTTKINVNLSSIMSGLVAVGGTSPVIAFTGVPTVLRSGVLTGATDAPWTVTDSTLPVSWASSGLLSTSSGTRFIRKTDGTKHAAMGYENSPKTAQTSPTTGYSAIYSVFGSASASFTAGDAYEVISLPKFPRVALPASISTPLGYFFIYLDMDRIFGGVSTLRLDGFRAPAVISNTLPAGASSLQGVIFVSGGSIQGAHTSNYFDRSLLMGSLQGVTWSGDLNTRVNVIAKAGQLFVSHSSSPRLGTLYVYDDTTAAILLDNNAVASIDAIHGSGNSGLIVNISYSGCSVNSVTTTPLTAFDATTSAAHPISVVGTQYDYTAIPIDQGPTHNASFTTNA